jgi:hypothetical protein
VAGSERPTIADSPPLPVGGSRLRRGSKSHDLCRAHSQSNELLDVSAESRRAKPCLCAELKSAGAPVPDRPLVGLTERPTSELPHFSFALRHLPEGIIAVVADFCSQRMILFLPVGILDRSEGRKSESKIQQDLPSDIANNGRLLPGRLGAVNAATGVGASVGGPTRACR